MPEEERTGVRLTNLDQPLYGDAGATKRDLVDYLDAVADRFVPVLAGRALSVVRILRGQDPFMQKNLPAYAPASIPTLDVPTQTGKRVVRYPVCDSRETLLWFANQRAVEYHPTLFRGLAFDSPSHLVVDIDPPAGAHAFARAPMALVTERADGEMDFVRMRLGARGNTVQSRRQFAQAFHQVRSRESFFSGEKVKDTAAEQPLFQISHALGHKQSGPLAPR